MPPILVCDDRFWCRMRLTDKTLVAFLTISVALRSAENFLATFLPLQILTRLY